MLKERFITGLFGNRTAKELDTLARAYFSQGKFAGAVLVACGDEILLSKGYGLANHEYDIPATPTTPYRIGSMTKPFTALAMMQLIEEGTLSLDDTVSHFLPDFPNGEHITIYHLLSNTSGIPDYILTPEYEAIKRYPIATRTLIDLFWHKPLQFEPGTDFGYSNSGWVLLGYLLEQIDGLDYGAVIQARIFNRAGMMHSGYQWDQPLIRGRAVGYADTGAEIIHADAIDSTTMHGAGGLYATAEDLYRWAVALRENQLVKRKTLEQMSKPIYEGYGLGWECYRLHRREVVAHSGGMPGFISNFVRFPAEDVIIILLSNLSSAAFADMTDKLAAAVFGEPYQLPSAHTFIDVDPALLADYTGDYTVTFFGRASRLTFTVEDGKLTMNVPGLPKSVLGALSETTFYGRSKGDITMTFVRGAGGRVQTIDMNWAGHKLTATRTE